MPRNVGCCSKPSPPTDTTSLPWASVSPREKGFLFLKKQDQARRWLGSYFSMCLQFSEDISQGKASFLALSQLQEKPPASPLGREISPLSCPSSQADDFSRDSDPQESECSPPVHLDHSVVQGLAIALHPHVPVLLPRDTHPLLPKLNIRNAAACFHVLGLVCFSMGYFYSCPDPSHTEDLKFQPKQ